MGKTIAVLFGGRSAEHEISVITALQAISAIDTLHYKVVPVYIHPSGSWYTGTPLLNRATYRAMPDSLNKLQQVTLLPNPSIQGLVPISAKGHMTLDAKIPIDAYFLTFHGQYGEDGCIQGLLELADAAYTGCGVLASAVAMNKYQCKKYLEAHGIPVLPAVALRRHEVIDNLESARAKVLSALTYPLFVKPCNLGSSVGIGIAHDERSLHASFAKAFRYDDMVIVEQCVSQLMEVNVSVMEGHPPIASVVEIPKATGEALTYEDKYLRGGGKKGGRAREGMASLTRVIDPQDLDPSIRDAVQDYALRSYGLLGCHGVGRFDFIYDKSCGALYFNELNPIPGSLSFYLWEKSHPSFLYTEMIDRIITGAMARKEQRLSLQKDIGLKALLS